MKKLILLLSLIFVCTVFCGCGKAETPYDYDLNEYVTLGDFPNVKYDADELAEKYQEAADEIASEYSTTEEITDRAVKDGDIVNIDYVGKIDGKEFEGGSDKGYDLTIGSDKFIPGFEDGLIGKNIGEEVTLNLVFPEDYDKELAGKDVVFTVKINGIEAEIIPALTDKMVADKTKYSTVSEYADATRKELAEDLLWDNYLSSCKVTKYPEKETKVYYDRLVDSYSQMAVYNGMTLEAMVTSYYGYKTLDEFLSYAMTTAMASVKEEMVLYLTARENNISITDEEYEEFGTARAKEYGYDDLEEYEDYMTEDGIKIEIYMEKIIEKAYEANNITFEKIESAETEPDDKKETNTEPEETKAETAA